MAETTLGEFKTAIIAALGTDSTAEDTVMTKVINEGYEQFVRDTHCFKDFDSMSLTEGTNTYTLPTQPLAILELYNTQGTTLYPLTRITLTEIIDKQRATSSSPARFYTILGMNLLVVYPTPGAGEEITMFWVPRPTPLSNSADIPTSVPAEFHQAIEYYALSRIAELDNHEPSQYGTLYRAYYEREVQKCKAAMHNIGGNRAAPLTAGMPDRRQWISNDRSQIFR